MTQRHDVPAERRLQLEEARRHSGSDVYVFEDFFDQSGQHPEDYRNCETSFAASMLGKYVGVGANLLDVGSNRLFVAGLSTFQKITTLDVRQRSIKPANETVLIGDSKSIPATNDSFDAVLSLNAIEHFGLGRYGDAFDLDADRKAFTEWRRVVRPGGHIVFSTTVNSHGPAVAFNAHRIYSYNQIEELCRGLTRVGEVFFSHVHGAKARAEDLSSEPGKWDLYAGIWAVPS